MSKSTRQAATLDLTVVVTAHNEGLVAHKTMLSVFRAAKHLVGVSYEVVVSIDCGDQDTHDYFSRYEDNPLVRVLDVEFKDLSASRNNAVIESRGRVITFIDADDLMSATWLSRGYELAIDTKSIIHPQYSITFGDDNLIWKKRDSRGDDLDTLCFIDNNLWDSPSMARREIYLSHPYEPNGNGFGYEDKLFHAITLWDDIPHLVAPETILFVRRKVTGSMLRQATTDRVTVAPNKLLSYKSVRAIDITSITPINANSEVARNLYITRNIKRAARHAHQSLKRLPLYNSAVRPIRERYSAKRNNSILERYPTWLIKEWREIHRIDNSTFPSKAVLDDLHWYNAENIESGSRYVQLVQKFTKQPDTLFFVPWIIKGGADMLFVNYPTELKRQHPDWHIAVLQTEKKESVWANKLPRDVDFVNIFNSFNGLDRETQERLLATLITQNGIKRIIIGNSQLAYDFVSHYQTLIRRLGISVYCFAFGEEFDDEGRLWGHIHTGIPRIYSSLYRIITDNNNTVEKLAQEYAFDKNRFRIHYQPTDTPIQTPKIERDEKIRVLWASRVCKQKRPDILKAVANKLTDEFIVDAYGQLEENLTESYFDDSRVNYKGPFNGVSSLPTKNYDIYLYTSEGDGVPNVLQEMTASGLPIVASNVGGIREFVKTNKTGILIEDHNNIDDYVAAIESLSNPTKRMEIITGAQALLREKFSKSEWKKAIQRDFDR